MQRGRKSLGSGCGVVLMNGGHPDGRAGKKIV